MYRFRRNTIARAAAAALGLSTVFFTAHSIGQQTTPRPQGGQSQAARPGAPLSGPGAAGPSVPRLACTSVQQGEPLTMVMGKSRVIQLPSPAIRLIGGGGRGSTAGSVAPPPETADAGRTPGRANPTAAARGGADSGGVAEIEITLLSPTELLVIGRRPGSANVIVQDEVGRCVVRDITITIDPQTLQGKLRELLPRESDVRISGAGDALVLTGSVTDAVTLDQILTVAGAYSEANKIINLLRVTAPQQVMLEVKIAEVSKALLDRFGLDFTRVVSSGDRTNVISGIIGGDSGLLSRFGPTATGTFGAEFSGIASSPSAAAAATTPAPLSTRGASLLGIDVDNRDGIVRLLAEPNIMAISGQAASFLSGGKIFIPVAQSSSQGGGTFITLEEKEFGVGLRFTPTVLDGRINLKMVSEVSELSQSGTPFTTIGNVTAVLPSMTTRRVDTTVQLGDGQSFAVAGLIRHNYAAAIDKFPGLGEAPVLGALFRSTEFQNDQTELLFVITPRLVKPATAPVALPTDSLVVPSRADVILRGKGEGSLPPALPATMQPQSTTAPPAPPAPSAPATPVTPSPPPPNRPTSGLPFEEVAVAARTTARSLPVPKPLPPLEPLVLDEPPHFE